MKPTLLYSTILFLVFMVSIQAYRMHQLEQALGIQVSINSDIVGQFKLIEKQLKELK